MIDRNDYKLEFLKAIQNITKIVDILEFEIDNSIVDDDVVVTYESDEVVETKTDEPQKQETLSLQLDKNKHLIKKN